MLSALLASFGLVHYVGLFVVLCTIWYFHRRRNYGVWEAKGLPSIKPNLLFGNKTEMFTGQETFMSVYEKLYNDFKGHRIAVIYDGSEAVLMLRDPDLIKTVLISDFDHFSDLGWFPECVQNISGNNFGLASARGERWKQLRAMMSPLFNLKALKRMTNKVDKAAEAAVEAMEKARKASPDGVVVIEDLCGSFTMDCAAGLTLSLNVDAQQNPNSEFIRMGKALFGDSWRMLLSEFMPWLVTLLDIPIFNQQAVTFFRRLVQKVGDERGWKSGGYDDMFDAMVKAKENGEEHMTSDVIVATIFQFLSDGYDSINFTLYFTMLELANNPEVQEKAFYEIEELGHLDNVTGDDIGNLKYMEQIFQETMRMHSIGFTVRRCTKNWKIPDTTITVPKGTRVILPISGIQMDEEYHPDPERFDPDRFSPENKGKIKQGSYQPFSLGPRMCPGYQLAKLEQKIFLYHVMKRFRLEACEKTPKKVTKDLLDMSSTVPRIKGGIWMKFVPRD